MQALAKNVAPTTGQDEVKNHQKVHISEDYNLFALLSHVDLPRFVKDNFKDWLYRLEQFFEMDKIPYHVKTRLASINMEYGGKNLAVAHCLHKCSRWKHTL
ncbi:Retrotransposon gag protein [Quillaja saponaria]|uniref:Retrotransposon gag protein n=1 Tax=Quillaja saponaria TaxID=32244 RepID=A0AAD7LLU6_QUISA|nr:Retrotransposon gag protein [Quillaja saponaria]